MVYSPRPGHESTRPARPIEGNPEFQRVLLDPEGRLLLSVAPRVAPAGCGIAADSMLFDVKGSLPLHPKAIAYELHRGEIVLYRSEIPSNPPKQPEPRLLHSANGLKLHWDAPNLGDRDAGTGHSQSGMGGTLPYRAHATTYRVAAVMESGQRITLARGLTEPVYSVDFRSMPVTGKGTLFLRTDEGVRSAEVEAGSIDVPARPPTVHILAPAPDSRLPFGQPMSVLGCCLAMNGHPCPSEGISWSVDDQRFAVGVNIAALEGLAPGSHRLTLSYQGKDDTLRVETSLTVEIEEPDEAYKLWEALTRSV